MPISVTCVCGMSYAVKDQFAGQHVKCPACGQVLAIPGVPRRPPSRPDTSLPTSPEKVRPGPTLSDSAGSGELVPNVRKGGSVVAVVLAVLMLLLLSVGGVLVLLAQMQVTPEISPPVAQQSPVSLPTPAPTPPNPIPRPRTEEEDTPPPRVPPTIETNPPATTAQTPWQGHTGSIVALAITADGRQVLTCSGGLERLDGKTQVAADTSIRLWDSATGKELSRQTDFPGGIVAAAFSPDGRQVVVAAAGSMRDGVFLRGFDLKLHLWDLSAKRELCLLRGHTRGPVCVAFSRNGQRLLSGGTDQKVLVWDVSSEKALFELEGHARTVNAVAVSPDGTLGLSAAGDKTVRLWSLTEGKSLRQLEGHQDLIWSLAFSPDGLLAASAGGNDYDPAGNGFVPGNRDYDVRIWDVSSGKELRRLHGHTDAVNALAFAPDGRRLLSGSSDKTVRLWQVGTGRELASFDGHTRGVNGVAFFPSSSRALSAGDDRVPRIWKLPPDIPDLVKAFQDPANPNRRALVQEIGKAGPDARIAIPILLEAIAPADLPLRRELIQALAQIGPPGRQDIPLLVPLLEDVKFQPGRIYALDMLTQVGAEAHVALAPLVRALGDSDPATRRKAVVILGQIGPAASKPAFAGLLNLLRDPDAEMVEATAATLGKLGKPPVTVTELRPLLRDKAMPVRRYALGLVTEMGAEAAEAAPELLAVFTDDKVVELRRQAIQMLLKVQARGKANLDAYVKGLKDPDGMLAELSVKALADLGLEGGALPGLLQALQSDNAMVSKTADEALGGLKLRKQDLALVVPVLKNKSDAVRLRILECLLPLGAEAAEAVPAVSQVLGETKGEPRDQALRLIAAIGPPARAAGPAVAELLKDEDRSLRLEVAVVLSRIEADEIKLAIPPLVRMLRIEDPTDEKLLEERKKVSEVLVQMGKPAIRGLISAVESEFFGGNPNLPIGMIKGHARLAAIQALGEIGQKHRSSEILQLLARVEGTDPFPPVKQAARELRVKLQAK